MSEIYKNDYAFDNMYGHVVKLISEMNISNGVNLDFACGYSAIKKGFEENNIQLDYIGIDMDKETIQTIKSNGTEAYCHRIGNQVDEEYEYIIGLLHGRKVASITILDFMEHITEHELFLKLIHKLSTEFSAPVIVSVPNVAHIDIICKLIEGYFDYTEAGLLDKTHVHLFTEYSLNKLMEGAGFQQTKDNDVFLQKSDQHESENNVMLSDASCVHNYISWLAAQTSSCSTVNQFVRVYLPYNSTVHKVEDQNHGQPFLSIIMRTQGKRLQELTEVLLCLCAQTNRNFEVLLMAHKLTLEAQISVEQIIQCQPEWLRRKIRYLKVDHGTRTTPLNEGYSQAKGRYVTILDDDDLVFDHWVEVFYNLFSNNNGKILHAYSVGQEWSSVATKYGNSLRAEESFQKVFCKDFNLFDQLLLNTCPTMSYAIPTSIFQKMRIRFDESLTTTEDWDFLLRAAFLCGVANSNQVTSVYRLWINKENSTSTHDRHEWLENEKAIRRKFTEAPFFLSSENVKEMITRLNNNNDPASNNKLSTELLDLATLYFDIGNGFNEEDLIKADYQINSNSVHVTYDMTAQQNIVHTLRFDPVEFGIIEINSFCATVTMADGQKYNYSFNNIMHNGFEQDGSLLFLKSDPQIIMQLSNPGCVLSVNIQCILNTTIDQASINKAIDAMSHPPINMQENRLLGRLRKLFRRLFN